MKIVLSFLIAFASRDLNWDMDKILRKQQTGEFRSARQIVPKMMSLLK